MASIRVHTIGWIDGIRRLWLRAHGIKGREVQTPQGTLRFLEVQGRGPLPPILLVHGLSSSAVDWGPTIRRLKKHSSRIRAIDLPGHGVSDEPTQGMDEAAMREMLISAADTYLDEEQIIIGNSLGGLAAVRMAGRKPDKAIALVLVSPGGSPIAQGDLDALLDRFAMDSWAKAHAFLDACMGGPHRKRLDLAWGVRARADRPSIRALVNRISRKDLLAPDELTDLKMPILLYWGQDDEILPEEHLNFYRSHLPSHTEVYTPQGMGHAPFLDSVGRFLEPVIEFCERLPQAEQDPQAH